MQKLILDNCLRRTGTTLIANSGVTIVELQRWGRWKSASVAQRYVSNSEEGKINSAKVINGEKSKIVVPPNAQQMGVLTGWTVNGNVQIILSSKDNNNENKL